MKDNYIKTLICDDSANFGIRIAAQLRENDIYAYTRKSEKEVILNSILSEKPDVVISDLSLKDTDAVDIMHRTQSLLSEPPQFIIISELNNSFVERQIIENGAACYLPVPVDIGELCSIVKSVAIKKDDEGCLDMELVITDMIRSFGVPAHIKGYRYLRAAVMECLDSKTCLESVTKKLYPRVAEKYDTTPSRVERAIRHAIEIAWTRADDRTIDQFFGYKVDKNNCRPTNSEFIAMAADRIDLKMKNSRAKALH